MTLLGALVVLLHLRRHNLDFLHSYIQVHISIRIILTTCSVKILWQITEHKDSNIKL